MTIQNLPLLDYILDLGTIMRKTAFVLLIALTLSAVALAADTYQTGKIVKWDNGTYPDGKKTKPWVVYQVQGDNNMLYSIARHKETKPQMQPGDTVQYQVKGNQMTVDDKGKKNKYQIVGQSQAAGQ
jgi:hypothetical protein